MRKRCAAGLLLTTAVASVWTAAPAQAYDDRFRDTHKPIPCNPYPPGKKYSVTVAPSAASVRRGASIDSVAGVYRGVGADKKPCKYHLVIMRYPSNPNRVVKWHRTGESGRVGFVVGPVNAKITYYYEMVYNTTKVKSPLATVTPR